MCVRVSRGTVIRVIGEILRLRSGRAGKGAPARNDEELFMDNGKALGGRETVSIL